MAKARGEFGKIVKSAAKTLLVLKHLNQLGSATVGDLHRETGMPKPTIVRLLHTLIHEGYAYKDHRMEGYQVTSQVAALASGFHSAPLVIEVARPYALDLTHQLKWPTALCTLDRDAMAVRYSTIPDSPMSPFHSTVGTRNPLATRAYGLSYLAFCAPDEQATLLDMLYAMGDDDTKPPRAQIEAILAATLARGYALRERPIDSRMGPVDQQLRSSATVAVPLKLGNRVMATFGVTYFKAAVAPSELEMRIVAPLQAAARMIETVLTQRSEAA